MSELTLDKIQKAAALMKKQNSTACSRYMMTLKQVRFPKTRNRRIRQKWANRIENYNFVALKFKGAVK